MPLIELIQSERIRTVNEDLRTCEITSKCAELMCIKLIMYLVKERREDVMRLSWCKYSTLR